LPLKKIKTAEFLLGPNIKVTVDKKSKSRVINFPFDFADDTKGVIVIIRLSDEEWVPNKDIARITLDLT